MPLFSRRPPRPVAPARRRQRPAVEVLEGRTVPSWLAQLGSPGDAQLSEVMAMDAGGNLYLCGEFNQPADFDPGPGTTPHMVAGATFDIVIDAYRIELLEPRQLGVGSGMSQYGWRIGSAAAGALALVLAARFGWTAAYFACAAFALPAMLVAVRIQNECSLAGYSPLRTACT